MTLKLVANLDVLDLVPHGIFVADSLGRVVFWNEQMEKWTNLPRHEVIGEILDHVFDKFSKVQIWEKLTPLFSEKKSVVFTENSEDFVFPIIQSDSSFMAQKVTATPLLLESGVHSLFTIEDVTYFKQRYKELNDLKQTADREIKRREALEKDLIAQRTLAVESMSAKSNFLSTMSHEIRTPMNGVIAMTSILKEMGLNEEQKEIVDIIYESGTNLIRIINDVLDMSKLDIGKLEFDKENFHFEEVMTRGLKLFEPKCREKNVKLHSTIDDKIPKYVIGDYGRILQVVMNLLSNAIKFTDKGDISFLAKIIDQVMDTILIQIEIEDNGIGITEEQQSRLFKKFSQADAKISTKFGGTGLGLSISKFIVEQMDGRIWVESKFGVGSKFIFQIELKEGQAPKLPEDIIEQANMVMCDGLKVLLVEDNRINQKIVEKISDKLGLKLTIANHGEEALEIMQSNEFELILMDLNMPIMDGYEATSRIHKLYPEANFKIVAMTAASSNEELSRIRDIGIDDVLLKPFNMDKFRSILRNFHFIEAV